MLKKLLFFVLFLSILLIQKEGNAQCTVIPPVPQDACWTQVVTNDAFCCDVLWDGLCQADYDACISGGGGCTVIPPVPMDACYNQVIANDPVCCDFIWDAVCQQAYNDCTSGGGGGGGGCNTDISICTPGTAGPFTFSPASPNPSSCLDYWNGAAAPNYAYIILYITQSGDLNLLIDGDQATGCLDVSIFDITGQADPCSSLGLGTEIGCNYASNCDGCNEFGSNFPCLSEVPAPYVNTGDVIMILVEDWSNVATNFTLELSNAPGSAQTGPPDPTINPAGPFVDTDPPFTMTAANGGGTWSSNCGPCIDPVTGEFDPSVAGNGTWQICYDIGAAPCDASDCINVTVGCVPPDINPIPNVNTCDSYTLPAITGTDLTGNEAYYTGPGGTGTQYGPGTVISSNTTIYIYDAPSGSCWDEESFTITLDTQDPTINCPGNLNAVCSIAEQPAYANLAAFQAAGGTVGDVDGTINNASFTLLSEVSDGNTCPEVVTRTYQIADNCGHTATCIQTITINDNINPTASNPAPINVECIGNVPAQNIAVVTDEADNCGVPTVAFVSEVSDGNTCPETITRTYSVTDACGNSINVTQTITVDDVTNPTASNPAPINVQCIGDVPAQNVNVVTDEADNCTAAPVVAFVSDVSDGNTCPETITRTYSVTDACGNSINVTQTITVDDVTNPTASNPAPINVECIGDVPAQNVAVVTDEADNCTAAPVVAFVSDVSDGNTCPEVITRTYSVTDECGNSINVTQTITVDDVTPPTASNPAPIVVECIGDVPAADPLVVTDEADNCGVPVVAFVSDVSDGNSCPETITRTYSVTDACGNTINVTQTITVDDTTDPTASNPPNINLTVSDPIPPADPTVVTDEADNCGVPVVAFVSDVSDGGNCPETITRTYSVTDACGNQILVTQLIIIGDGNPPTASNPAPINVECIGDVPAPDPAVVTDEADNGGVPVVAWDNDASDGNTCPEVITRTYSVTDDCGNVIFVTQTITVDDVTPPTGTAPADITVECIGDVPASDPALIVDEADNCTVAPVVAFVSDVSDGNTCPEVITRTYSITDECGNVTNVTQTITVDDTTDPTASNPPNINTTGAVPGPDITVVTDEADNCTASPIVAFVSDVSDGNSCPETITRTYSVTDDCGNQILVTQLIIIGDPNPPTASNPLPINVECIGDVPAPDPAVVTDEADDTGVPVVAFVSDVSDGNTCPEVISRTYSITDDCANQILVTQTITVDDVTDPTGTAPANVNVECIGDVPAADPTLIIDEADNCTVNPVVAHVSDVSDGNTCPETITRTYSITDDCGNSIDVIQTITVDDVTPPTGTAPANVVVECIGDVPAADPTLIIDEADNCTAAPVVAHVSDVSDGNTCPEVITRTYSITDDCGNVTNVVQTITVDDVTDPTASNPANINITTADPIPPADPLVVIDEADNCGVPVVAFVSDVSDGGNCPETITRTYSVTDACGNQILVTQLIIIGDADLPTASNPAPINVECIGDVPAPDPLVVTDEADNGGVPVVAWDNDASDGNTCPEVITRTYSVTDDCGNVIFVTQTITVDDITPPTGTAPANVNVECIGDVPAADPTLIVDEADNCTVTPVVAHVSDVSDGNTCPETITRTYSITDDCGNSIDVIQTITVDDITPPTGTAPANVVVECIGDVPAADPTLIVDEADNCTANPVVAFVSDVSDGNTCPEVITRTYSITDDCGNVTNVVQTITVDDITPPTASNPVQTIVPGGPAPAPDVNVVIDEADNCSVPVVAFVSQVSDGNPCPETITYTYSVTDDCGNSINVTHEVLITDPIMPTASNPPAINVECIGDVPAPDPAVVTDEADNQGVPVVAWVDDVSDGNTCPETITRTYSVTDLCGNVINVTQTIIVDDITDPTASNPVPVVVECIGDVPAPDITVVTDEADNCTVNPVVAFVSDVSDGNTCPEIITRTYSVTDDCGNSINVTQTITVDDTTPPTGTAPADVVVECIGDVPAADPTLIVDEADNCTANPVVAFVSDVSDGNTCPETITRTYSITDDCGNVTNVTQTITVDDTTPPTASNAAQTIVPGGPAPAPDPTVIIDEADNCGVPTVAFVSQVSDGNPCPESIIYTYSVTDDCGNSINVTHEVLITDPINPTASNPAPINVECIGDVPAPDITVVTDEADNNGIPTVAFVSDVSDGNTCPETITRTYSVTDVCGNQILVTQTITVDDVTDPTASNPAPVVVECIGDVPAADITVVTDEADNCTANPVVAFVSDVSDGNTCPETITRTYSITDDCGNTINVTQTITVDDTTPPTASNPAPVVVECIGDVPAADITVVTDEADNCTANPVVAFVSDVSDGNTCPETITRTYSVTDDCGNSINVTQTITVDDITNPTASNPAPIIVNCLYEVPAPDPAVVTDEADNCTAIPVVAWVSDVSDNNSCNGEIITRTYSVTDECGNSINVTQSITISSMTPTVDGGTDQAVCDGETVTLTANASAGATISWDNGISNGVAFQPTVGTTAYTVTAEICIDPVTNIAECSATDVVQVTGNPLPDVDFMAPVTTGCEPTTISFDNLTTGNSANCVWEFGDGNTANACGQVSNTYMNAGTYSVTLTVTSDEGCVSSETYNDYITIEPYPIAGFIADQYEVDLTDTEVQFTNESMNADTYSWDFGDLSAGSTSTDPNHFFPEIGNMSYEVQLIASNYAGCSDTAWATIYVQDVLIFYVPNVFTPDGDSYNELFTPIFTAGYDPYDYHLTIFNRWGEVIFESYDASVGWDGTYGGQGLVEDGVYIWQIEFGETMSDKRNKHRGHVTVLK